MSYRLIDELQMKAVPVAQTCRLLGVSRAGFYEAKRRAAAPMFCKASVHLRAAFMSSGQTYGSRRFVRALANSGLQVGRYKVRRLMQQASLKPVWKRKFVHTTDSKHALPVAPNVLARQFNPVAPNLAYASDITYIRTGAGWLYLAVVLDLFSRRVVGWAMAPNMPAALVCAALRMAIQARRPAAGLVVHSDRGSQYASDQYQALLTEHDFVCSMSRKGNCWDNAVAERFFLNLRWSASGSAIMRTKPKPSLMWPITSPASTTASACILYWAICRPACMNAQWQRKNLSSCPKLLDHYKHSRFQTI